jgi:hypothetical protein
MKRLILILALLWNDSAALFAQTLMSFGSTNESSELVIHSNGAAEYRSRSIAPRSAIERHLRTWARYSDDNETSASITNSSSTNATSAEVASRLRPFLIKAAENQSQVEPVIQIGVSNDAVHVEQVQKFESVESLLRNGAMLWYSAGLMLGSVVFETDTNQQVRITLVPERHAESYARRVRPQWKAARLHLKFRLTLPGRIISSGLPETDGRSTGLVIDSSRDESLDALMALQATPISIVAEPGGLQLVAKLDSKKLRRAIPSAGNSEGLPVTEAGPGFSAESLSLTLTTHYRFPGTEKYFKSEEFDERGAGAVLNAKLSAPRERFILSLENARVIRAVDDKGRELSVPEKDEESSVSIEAEPGPTADVVLRTELPPNDASAIDELTGEVIAMTGGGWKTMTVTNISESSTNVTIDLDEVLPGARFTMKKWNSRSRQLSFEAELTGPAEVAQLILKFEAPDGERFSSHAYNRSVNTKAGVTTRRVTVQAYMSSFEEGDSAARPPLVIRLPQEVRRERVEFKLEGLDLL